MQFDARGMKQRISDLESSLSGREAVDSPRFRMDVVQVLKEMFDQIGIFERRMARMESDIAAARRGL